MSEGKILNLLNAKLLLDKSQHRKLDTFNDTVLKIQNHVLSNRVLIIVIPLFIWLTITGFFYYRMIMKQQYFIYSNAINQKKNIENFISQTQILSTFILDFKLLILSDKTLANYLTKENSTGLDYNFLLNNRFIENVIVSDSVITESLFDFDTSFAHFNLENRLLQKNNLKQTDQNFIVSQSAYLVPDFRSDSGQDTLIITYSMPHLVIDLDRMYEEQYFFVPAGINQTIKLSCLHNPLPNHLYRQVPAEVCNKINENLSEIAEKRSIQKEFFTERTQVADTVYCAAFFPVINLKSELQGFFSIYFIDGYYKYYFSEFIKRTIAATVSLIIIFFLYYRNYAQQIILVNQNISIREDQKQLQIAKEKAEEANKVKSEFLANMSHEIRTPMNTVLGFTDLLNAQITDPQQKRYLAAITAGTKNLLYLINDILDLSKIEAGKMEIAQEPVNPRVLFTELESVFADLIKEKQLDFLIEVHSSVPQSLILDEIRLKQILFNLIGNAIKFTEKGYIHLSAHTRSADNSKSNLNLIIKVKDSGIGIHANYQDQIFNAFQQQDNKLTKKYGGTGLGLSISQKLARLMNGDIQVESEPGQGSTFTVTLKNIQQPEAEVSYLPELETENQSFIFEEATVLIVDDVGHNRFLLKEYLKTSGFKTYEAVNGNEAVETTRLVLPDLILMDIRMPVMDGIEATKIIKGDALLKQTFIVALSASVMDDEIQKIQEVGFDDFLRKPVKLAELLKSLAKFLPNKQCTQPPTFGENQVMQDVEMLNPEKVKAIEQLIKGEFFERWKNVANGGFIDEIAIFGNDLIAAGKKYACVTLINFGESLVESTESFDVGKMKKVLNSYNDLLKKIKET